MARLWWLRRSGRLLSEDRSCSTPRLIDTSGRFLFTSPMSLPYILKLISLALFAVAVVFAAWSGKLRGWGLGVTCVVWLLLLASLLVELNDKIP